MERTAVQSRRPAIKARANPLPITGLRTVSLLELPVKVYGHTLNLDASAGWRRMNNEYGDIAETQASFEASYGCLSTLYIEGDHVISQPHDFFRQLILQHAFSAVRADHAWAKAEASRTLCDEIGGKRAQ
jgi:hypothetical protein